MKNSRGGQAVTEIIGAMLLIAMTITVFAVIYSNVLSDDGPDAEKYATIVGTLANENGDDLQDIVFDLSRGDSLGSDAEVVLDIGGDRTFHVTVEDNPDMIQNDNNEYWNIGDRFVYHPKYEDGTYIDLTRLEVKANIIDRATNSLVFWGTLQKGWTFKDYLGGIWHFDETYSQYSKINKDVLDTSGNDNHGIAGEGARHIMADPPEDILNPPADNNPDNVISGLGSCFFSGIKSSNVLVENHYSLNIQDDITIEAWMKPLDTGFMRTTSNFDAPFGYNPDVIHSYGDIYAITADGKTNESSAGVAMVATVIINLDGTTEEIVDANNPYILDKPGTQPDIVKVSEDEEYNYFAIAYSSKSRGQKNSFSGFLKIVKIKKTDGTIYGVFEEKPTHIFDVPACWPDIINVDNNFYVITYSDKTKINENGNLYLQTIEIDVSNGTITSISKIPIDTLGNDPNILKISNTIYAITYRHLSSGYVTTVEIDPMTGSIIAIKETKEFDSTCNYPDMIHVSDDVYAIAYSSVNDAGSITTMIINPNDGTITLTMVKENFDDDYGSTPDITHIQGDLYAIVYSTGISGNPNGRIVKLSISDAGKTINNIEMVVDRFYDPFYHKKSTDGYYCYTPVFIRLSEYVHAVAYRSGVPHEGQISTFSLLEYLETPYERGIFKSGSINIYAINSPHGSHPSGVYASVKIVDTVTLEETEYPLYTDKMKPNDWNHISLTFDGTNIYLYCNGQLEDAIGPLENPENKILKTSNADLLFGYLFFGYIDEIAIIDHALPLTAPEGEESIYSHYINPGFFENEP